MIPVIIGADDLAALPQAVLVDVRWYLDGRDGRAAYESGHLPGAVWVDLAEQLAAHDAPAVEGRHPFPSPERFAAAMSSIGVGDGATVVAYDDTGGLTAGRLVVMLRMLGESAALLDGGLRAWPGEVHQGWVEPVPATFSPRPWPADRLATADETAALAAGGGVVMDARSHERFTGEVTQIDPRPGHVPGAVSAPWSAVLDTDGRVRTPADLRAHYSGLGVNHPGGSGDAGDGGGGDPEDTAIAYCGSGVSACMNIIAMEHAGFTPPRLYVASWSGWSADPDRPAALGE